MNKKSLTNFSWYTFLGIIVAISSCLLFAQTLEINIIVPIFIALIGTSLIFWFWVLFDCIAKDSNNNTNKILWILLILFTNRFGALGYFLIRRPQRIKELGK